MVYAVDKKLFIMEILFIIVPLVMIAWLILRDVIDSIKEKKYADGIHVGDMFVDDSAIEMSDEYEGSDDFYEFVDVIKEIKTDENGETWVTYERLCCREEYTESITEFLAYRTFIRDIDDESDE
jgi:hypothetical protein